MAISTIVITATRDSTPATVVIRQGPAGPAGADGADGADGSDANVTNANVNSAISADTAATLAVLGLENVDNTADANKPVSTATQTALDGKLSVAGGNMTGGIDMGTNPITSVADGILPDDVAAVGQLSSSLYTVSALPAASLMRRIVMVIDSTAAHAGNSGNIVTGGGSVTLPVYSDGTNWRIV